MVSSARRGDAVFAAIVWLVALLVAAVFVAAAWLLYRDGDRRPLVGWTETRQGDGWRVDTVDPAGPASGTLAPGDRLVAMNGDRHVAQVGARFHQRLLRIGDTYRLIVERGGAAREATLAVASQPGALARRLSYFLICAVWCAVALFIGFLGSARSVARLAFAAAAAGGLLFGFVGLETGLYHWSPLHVAIGYHFFYRFPGGVLPGRPWNAVLLLLHAGALTAVGPGQWFNWLLLTSGPAAATEAAARYPVLVEVQALGTTLLFGGAVVAIGLVIVRNYRLVPDGDARRRIRWVAAASLAGVAPAVAWAILALGQPEQGSAGVLRTRPAWIAFSIAVNVASTAVPLSVAYAVVKHRVFDVSVAIRRGLQYLLARRALQGLLALPLIALVITIMRNREQTIGELVTGSAAYAYWIVAAGLSLRFRRPLGAWLDRRFFREQYDREQLLVGLVEALEGAETVSDVARLMADRLERALHPKACYLWFRDGLALTLSHSTAAGAPLELSSEAGLLKHLASHTDVAAVPDLPLTDDQRRWLTTLGVNLIVPILAADGELLGVTMLGEKKSEEPYGTLDRRLLQAIGRQTAVVLENLRLKQRVGEERRIRQDVLARLDGARAKLLAECPACGACFDGGAVQCDRDGEPLLVRLPIERVVNARYRLDRLIGRGGMGAVYEAQDLRLDRQVAVKVMISRDAGQRIALRRFQREARAAARLNHPNVVAIHDYGAIEPDGAFLVMERVPGQTLRAELERARALAPAAAAEWIDPLLDGLQAAHHAGIVHRDLKPENVIGHRNADGRLSVKVLDFGLAKLRLTEHSATGTMTAVGAVLGTFGYMSPEQLLAGEVDHRADVFAVGVMVAEMVTGTRPFRGATYLEILNAVLIEPYHLPGATPAIRRLDALLQQCLAKDPRNRLASVATLRTLLVDALRACPPLVAGGASLQKPAP